MDIKVLGPGCRKCHETERVVKEVLKETGVDASFEYITDISKIAGYGVLTTPGLLIDGKVKSAGKVPSKAEIKSWLGK